MSTEQEHLTDEDLGIDESNLQPQSFDGIFYSFLIYLTIIGTVLIIVIGFNTASDMQGSAGDEIIGMSLLSILPMLITCKILDDIKKLLLAQKSNCSQKR